MKEFLIILLIIIVSIVILGLIIYIIGSKLINPSFVRMDFVEGEESISYNDIKDKYRRSEYEFKSKKNKLKAYLYKGTNDILVIYVHGMCPGHQCYLSDIIALIDLGYNVFTYDFTGTGLSEGKKYCGLNQQYYDLLNALSYLKENDFFGFNNVHLYGHSMGGYAVACMNDKNINSIVSISGFNSPVDEGFSVFSKGKGKMFKIIALIIMHTKFFLDQGFKYNLKASNNLKKTTINTLVIHGNNDELVDFKTQSILSKKELIKNDKVEYLVMDDPMHNGHNTLLASTECVEYQKPFFHIFNQAISDGKSRKEARQLMLKDLDPFKFNIANPELMAKIDEFYQKNNK